MQRSAKSAATAVAVVATPAGTRAHGQLGLDGPLLLPGQVRRARTLRLVGS